MSISSRGGPTILFALAGLCLATVLALLAPLGWPFELFTHFRAQYAAAGLVLGMALLAVRRPGWGTLAAGLAVFHALPALPRTVADEPAAACAGASITVATANLLYSNGDRGRLQHWLASRPADLIVLQEVTPEWATELANQPFYPHSRLLVREDPYGIGVLSRWPLLEISARDLAGDSLPSLDGRVAVGGRQLRFIGLHTRWPLLPRLARWRDASLRAAADLVRAEDGPVIALGDLNVTPFSPEFAEFQQSSGLRDVMHGDWWQPTWRADFWPLALRIDHVLVSRGLCVEQAEVGPDLGSDHRPVIAHLRFAAAPGERAAAGLTPAPGSPRSAVGTPGSRR